MLPITRHRSENSLTISHSLAFIAASLCLSFAIISDWRQPEAEMAELDAQGADPAAAVTAQTETEKPDVRRSNAPLTQANSVFSELPPWFGLLRTRD